MTLVSLPFMWRSLVQGGTHRLTLLLLTTALVSPLLTLLAAQDHVVDVGLEVRTVSIVVRAALLVALITWAGTFFGGRTIAALFAAGVLVQGILDSFQAGTAAQGNPWKYLLAWPVGVLCLSIARNRVTEWLVIGSLVAVSISADYRSFAAICLIAGLLGSWARRRAHVRGVRKRALVMAAVVGLAVYALGQQLALRGTLGQTLQDTTQRQELSGAPLILGGRFESAAALPLAVNRPIGFGPGVLPNTADIARGEEGLNRLGVNLHDPYTAHYVEDFMFGGGFRLHSITSDLWSSFGLLGCLAAFWLWRLVAAGFGRALVSGAGPLFLLVSVESLWDLAFSPLDANGLLAVFTAALFAGNVRMIRDGGSVS
jgi:hypothetical protein